MKMNEKINKIMDAWGFDVLRLLPTSKNPMLCIYAQAA